MLWLVAVYLYSIGGAPAAARHVSPKRLVKTALGGKPPVRRLETRSRPVTADIAIATTEPDTAPPPRSAAPEATPSKESGGRSIRAVGHALPVAEVLASGDELREPHHDYAALDIGVRTGTKVRAVTAGRITGTTRWGACGKGVILRGKDGFTYTYCHGSRLQVGRGRFVAAGHTLMRSGNSGDSTGPHLHLQIRRPDGKLVCPQDLLPVWEQGIRRSPWEAKRHGCHTGGHRHDSKRKKNKR